MSKVPGPHYIIESSAGAYLGIDRDGDTYWFGRFIDAKRFESADQARNWAEANLYSGYDFTVVPIAVH